MGEAPGSPASGEAQLDSKLAEFGQFFLDRAEQRNLRARDHSEIAAWNSCEYCARVNRVTGTYRNGKVALDQPVDWPEGTHVVCEYGAQPERVDCRFDGSSWEDTPEAIQSWVEWFDSLEPVLTGQELEHFESELRSARDEQKALLPKWQERIDNLLE